MQTFRKSASRLSVIPIYSNTCRGTNKFQIKTEKNKNPNQELMSDFWLNILKIMFLVAGRMSVVPV